MQTGGKNLNGKDPRAETLNPIFMRDDADRTSVQLNLIDLLKYVTNFEGTAGDYLFNVVSKTGLLRMDTQEYFTNAKLLDTLIKHSMRYPDGTPLITEAALTTIGLIIIIKIIYFTFWMINNKDQ